MRSSHTDTHGTTSGITADLCPARVKLARKGHTPTVDCAGFQSPANWHPSRPAPAVSEALIPPWLVLHLDGGARIVYTRPVTFATLLGDPACPSPQPAFSVLVQRSPASPGLGSGGLRIDSRSSWKKLPSAPWLVPIVLSSRCPVAFSSGHASRMSGGWLPEGAVCVSPCPAIAVACPHQSGPVDVHGFPAQPHACPGKFGISLKKSAKNCLSPARPPQGVGLARDSSPLHPRPAGGTEQRRGALAGRPTLPGSYPCPGGDQSARLSCPPWSGTVRHCLPTGRPA